MLRMLLGTLVLAVLPMSVSAQNAPAAKDAKQETGKPNAKEMQQPESKPAGKDTKPGDSTTAPAPPARLSLDKLKLPANAVIIVIEKLQEAAEMIPRAIYVSPEKYQEWQDRIRQLEQQLKAEKTTPHSCQLSGRVEGDYVSLRANFTFATQQPRTTVVLGLQGAHLVDEGDLDKTAPQLEYGDDGFIVRVDKEGPHQLSLNLTIPLSWKRSQGLGNAVERGFELGLPGAPATTLALDLPAGIKDLRVDDVLKKGKAKGKWETTLGPAKQVAIAWREPLAQPGSGSLLTLDAQIVVKLEEAGAQLQAELTLGDLRGQAKEWRLLLPPGVTPTVKSLPAAAYQWLSPDGKNPHHVLQLKEPIAEPIGVTLQANVAWPAAKLTVGPFTLAGASQQRGTVLVQATPNALRGQRLVYHRFGDVTQLNLPKSSPGADNLAFFRYSIAASGPAASKAPLALEFKASSGLAETQTDHTVRLKGEPDAWFVETTTRIQAKSLGEIADFLDVQLPRSRFPGLESLGITPWLSFPASCPWPSALPFLGGTAWALPLELRWEDEGSEQTGPGGARRAKLKWSRPNGKQQLLTIHGKYAVPPGHRRIQMELPRPLGSLDHGGSLSVASGPLVELLAGPPGAEEAVPDRHQWQRQTDAAPATVDLAWRPYQPSFPVFAVVDVTVYEHSAHVRQHLQFTMPGGNGVSPAKNVRLQLPKTLAQVAVESGGKLLGEPQPGSGWLWATPLVDAAGKSDLVLEYDVPLPEREPADGPRPAPWNVPLIWPEAATRQEAKVRVWCAPGTIPSLAVNAGPWHDRGIESVPARDSLPALVVYGAGTAVPLALSVQPSSATVLATLVCDRTLVQVHIDEEGNQSYRVRFLVRKLAARSLTLELPVPVRGERGDNLQAVRFGLDRQEKVLHWTSVGNIATIKLPSELPNFQGQQVFLDVEYKLPASIAEGKRFGSTLLAPPRWHGDVLPGTVRWQVDLPGDQVAIVMDGNAVLDNRWNLHGGLVTPEASVSHADLETWLTGREGTESTPVSLAYWRPGLTTQRLIHVPRPWWLLLCSGVVLAAGLALMLLPLARWFFGLVVTALIACGAATALLWPALVPPILYGCEPGLGVLAALIVVQWLLQERYRRQVVFLPGFARKPVGSSLTRAGQPASKREPSTVDAPARAVNSSAK
jgi:hypothetical protein